MAEFLDSISRIDGPLRFVAVAYVNKKTHKPEGVVLYSFLGASYIDETTGKMIPMQPDNPRLEMYRSYDSYLIPMDSEDDFNSDSGRPVGMDLFVKGELTEKWLQDHSGNTPIDVKKPQG